MPSPSPAPESVNRWLVAVAVMSSAVMEVLDTSVVNVSLPHIAGSLGATVDEATWVLTSYLVANAIVLPITGWLSNYVGRKRLLQVVVSGFTISSFLCGLAPNLGFLILFRVLQGTTGGGLQPLSQAVLLEEFPPEERGTAMAVWGMGIVVMPILGPMLGGWITDNYSWRWVFYINLPIGILSLLLIQLFIFDPSYIRRGAGKVDFWGLGLLTLWVAALQIMLDKGQEDDWFSSHLIVTLAVLAIAGLAAFIVRELMARDPVVHLRLLTVRTYATGVGLITVLGLVLYGGLVLVPLFLQDLLGYSATTAGMLTSPRGLGTLVLMPLAGFLLGRRFDARWLMSVGLVTTAISFFLFSHITLMVGVWMLFWLGVLQGAGFGFLFVPLTTATMDPIAREEMGYATSIYSLARNIGGSFGISFTTTMLARRAQFHQAVFAAELSPSRNTVRQFLAGAQGLLVQHGSDAVTAAHQAQGMLYGIVQQQANYAAYMDMFYLFGVIFLVSVPAVWLMRKPRAGQAASGVH